MSTYYYLTEYVPVRFSATYEQRQARQIVYNFKDGMYNESLMNKFTGAINNIGKTNAMVCFIPASSNERTQKRFGRLSSYINSHSNWTADMNAIRRTQDSLPGHVYGKSSNPAGDFVINSSVRGKNIILIDDVITRGQTFNDTVRKLMAAGAASVTGLFLAKTVHPAA